MIHFVKSFQGPLCGDFRPGDIASGRWVRVDCLVCLALRKTESERVRAYQLKKKAEKESDSEL